MLANGGIRFSRASVKFEIIPSLLPVSTSQDGPLLWKNYKFHIIIYYVTRNTNFINKLIGRIIFFITAATTSLATKATMSAHETTPGHAFSSADLTLSIIWNPRRLRFGTAYFSACFVEEFKSTEPSQPYRQSHEC